MVHIVQKDIMLEVPYSNEASLFPTVTLRSIIEGGNCLKFIWVNQILILKIG